jgi:peptide/nickel transport system ATP-binding protein
VKPEFGTNVMTPPVLEVEALTVEVRAAKRTLTVVDGVSFEVQRGETLAIVGESGAGKSITALSIMRLLPPHSAHIASGRVLFNGEDLATVDDQRLYRLRGNELAMIFQEPMTALNPVLTIGEQLYEVLRHHKSTPRAELRPRAAAMLASVGFADATAVLSSYPHRLSGGMRQRVMIAMAMACEPKLLIADEPTTALDVTVQAQILDLIRKLAARTGTAVILITHNLGLVAELADRVLVMYAGQIVERAKVADLFDRPSHPYTRGLMRSVPKLDGDFEQRLAFIPGSVPQPDAYPRGCRFSTRCAERLTFCSDRAPVLVGLERDHEARCLLHSVEAHA